MKSALALTLAILATSSFASAATFCVCEAHPQQIDQNSKPTWASYQLDGQGENFCMAIARNWALRKCRATNQRKPCEITQCETKEVRTAN